MYLRERNHVLRFVSLQVPTPFLFGLVRGLFDVVCVGDAFGKWALRIGQFLTHCETFCRSDARSDAADVPEWSFSLRPEMFGHADQIIRGGYYEDADEGNFAPKELDILHWLDTMSSFSVAGLARMRHVERDGRMAQRSIYKTEYMIRCLLLACHLRGDGRLETVVEQSGVLIGMEPGWIRSNGDDCLTLPSRSRMCTMRFYLDCGLCLLMQAFWELLLEGGDDFIICMLADSSPRVGKDWLLAELFVITDSAIARLLEVQEALVQAFACEHVDWERVRELEAHAHHQLKNNNHNNNKHEQAELEKLLRHHILIPVANGVANSGLACKWAALVHAWRVEVRRWMMLAKLLRRVLCVTTDFGTESGLSRVPHIDPNQLWPHWIEEADMVDDSEFAPMPETPLVSFDSSMAVPWTEHICHNVFKHVTKHLSKFQPWLQKAKAVSKMFSDILYKERFCERCIPDPWFKRSRDVVMGAIREPLDHRFMSVVEFLEDFLPLKSIVLHNFSAQKMFTKKRSAQAEEDTVAPKGSEQWIDQDLVTGALLSPAWWNYGVVMEAIGHAPEHIVFVSRSCKCHKCSIDADDLTDTMSFICGHRKRCRIVF